MPFFFLAPVIAACGATCFALYVVWRAFLRDPMSTSGSDVADDRRMPCRSGLAFLALSNLAVGLVLCVVIPVVLDGIAGSTFIDPQGVARTLALWGVWPISAGILAVVGTWQSYVRELESRQVSYILLSIITLDVLGIIFYALFSQ